MRRNVYRKDKSAQTEDKSIALVKQIQINIFFYKKNPHRSNFGQKYDFFSLSNFYKSKKYLLKTLILQ